GRPCAAGSTRTPTRPESGRSARPRSDRDAPRYSGSPRSVCVELLGKKHRRRLEDLVRATQLEVLLAQLLDLLTLGRAQQLAALAAISLGLAHTLAQRLRVNTQVGGDPRDRPPGLEHEPNAALHQLIGILPRSWHPRRVSSRQDRILVSEPPSKPAWLKGF